MPRYNRELETIRQLERDVDWLVGEGWKVDAELRMCFRFSLYIGPTNIPLTLRYGSGFPSAPPSVFPDPTQRLSDHQYGNGDLCLEYGPDTWLPDISGADLIRSAHRLLSGEIKTALDPSHTIPSRHELTLGQATRGHLLRFVLTAPLQEFLAQAPRGQLGIGSFKFKYDGATAVYFLVIVSNLGEEPWADEEIPSEITKAGSLKEGIVLGVPNGTELPRFDKRADVESFLNAQGCPPTTELELLFLFSDSEARFLWITDDGDVLVSAVLLAKRGVRLSAAHELLTTKRVGIVGCGSIGSKIAAMLARAGIRNFVLVDDDVFLPENLVRNELTWKEVGQHKADAVAQRISLIAPQSKCTVKKQRLGGQESNTVADSTIHRLQDCDLVVDASANATVFNVLSDAMSSSSKLFVWAEVFSGGIGGLIARCRPIVDPHPQTIRAGIHAWCAEQGMPAPRPTDNYGAETYPDRAPWIADDADVTIIAAHAARFAIDLLLERNPSWYPFSAYLIGLSPAWLFSEPFVTFPIDFSDTPHDRTAHTNEGDAETLAGILNLIAESRAEAANPS